MQPNNTDQNAQPSAGNMDPKEIEQFKQGFQIARQLLYQEQVFDALVQDVQKGDATMAIAMTLVQILMKVQKSIGQLSLSVASALGIALIDDLVQMLTEIGAVKEGVDVQQVYQQAVFVWLEENQYPPEVISEELQRAGAPPEAIQQFMQQQQGQQEQPQPQQQPQGLLAKGMR